MSVFQTKRSKYIMNTGRKNDITIETIFYYF